MSFIIPRYGFLAVRFARQRKWRLYLEKKFFSLYTVFRSAGSHVHGWTLGLLLECAAS